MYGSKYKSTRLSLPFAFSLLFVDGSRSASMAGREEVKINMSSDVGNTLLTSLNNALILIVSFVPKFVIGLTIILVGIIIASILKDVVLQILKTLKVEMLLKRYGVPEAKDDLTWTNILSQTVRWFIIVAFLVPAADIWGLPRVSILINQFLLYVPNVFVAAIIALVGFVVARIAHNVIQASAKGLSEDTANTIASIAHWAIIVFVALAVLNQLGVATDLIRILLIGFVAMIALAGGLAFGLGGKDTAANILEGIKKKLK